MFNADNMKRKERKEENAKDKEKIQQKIWEYVQSIYTRKRVEEIIEKEKNFIIHIRELVSKSVLFLSISRFIAVSNV